MTNRPPHHPQAINGPSRSILVKQKPPMLGNTKAESQTNRIRRYGGNNPSRESSYSPPADRKGVLTTSISLPYVDCDECEEPNIVGDPYQSIQQHNSSIDSTDEFAYDSADDAFEAESQSDTEEGDDILLLIAKEKSGTNVSSIGSRLKKMLLENKLLKLSIFKPPVNSKKADKSYKSVAVQTDKSLDNFTCSLCRQKCVELSNQLEMFKLTMPAPVRVIPKINQVAIQTLFIPDFSTLMKPLIQTLGSVSSQSDIKLRNTYVLNSVKRRRTVMPDGDVVRFTNSTPLSVCLPVIITCGETYYHQVEFAPGVTIYQDTVRKDFTKENADEIDKVKNRPTKGNRVAEARQRAKKLIELRKKSMGDLSTSLSSTEEPKVNEFFLPKSIIIMIILMIIRKGDE